MCLKESQLEYNDIPNLKIKKRYYSNFKYLLVLSFKLQIILQWDVFKHERFKWKEVKPDEIIVIKYLEDEIRFWSKFIY